MSSNGSVLLNRDLEGPHSCAVFPEARQSGMFSLLRNVPRTSKRSVPVSDIFSHHMGALSDTSSDSGVSLSNRVPGVTTKSTSCSFSPVTKLLLRDVHIESEWSSPSPNTQLDFTTTSTSQPYLAPRARNASSRRPACEPPANTTVAVGCSGAFSSSQ